MKVKRFDVNNIVRTVFKLGRQSLGELQEDQ